jgi:exopolyphosphatase
LRLENIYALSLAGLQNDVPELLCIDDISWTGMFPSNKFALVDHNRLLPQYGASNPDAHVSGVVDHHEDEGFYNNSAEPRIIAPAGSCASHIAHLCPPQIPVGLASLLLAAISIDTQGLKAGGKALQVDHEAVAFLLSKTPLSSSISATNLSQGPLPPTDKLPHLPFIQNLTTELSEKKISMSHLSTWDLLQHDYKQYRLNLPWFHLRTAIDARLSTVPVNFKLWIPRDPKNFWSATKQWMEERELFVLGISMLYRHERRFGKSRRESTNDRCCGWFERGQRHLRCLNRPRT